MSVSPDMNPMQRARSGTVSPLPLLCCHFLLSVPAGPCITITGLPPPRPRTPINWCLTVVGGVVSKCVHNRPRNGAGRPAVITMYRVQYLWYLRLVCGEGRALPRPDSGLGWAWNVANQESPDSWARTQASIRTGCLQAFIFPCAPSSILPLVCFWLSLCFICESSGSLDKVLDPFYSVGAQPRQYQLNAPRVGWGVAAPPVCTPPQIAFALLPITNLPHCWMHFVSLPLMFLSISFPHTPISLSVSCKYLCFLAAVSLGFLLWTAADFSLNPTGGTKDIWLNQLLYAEFWCQCLTLAGIAGVFETNSVRIS